METRLYPKLSRSYLQASETECRCERSCLLSNHGMTLRSLNKGPEGVSYFLSRIPLAYRFCKLITCWTCGFGLLHVPKTITPVVNYMLDK